METQINYEIWIKTSDGKNNYRQIAWSADPNPDNWYEIYVDENGNLVRVVKYCKLKEEKKVKRIVYYQRGVSPVPEIKTSKVWW